MASIHLLVEGDMDEAVGAKILEAAGHTLGTCYGKKGCGYIKNKIDGFNKSARDITFLTLLDFMDTGSMCPGEVVKTWLPRRQPRMIFRIVVRELESWLLADRDAIAEFLMINSKTVPAEPERIVDPKQTLVNLARKSRSSQIRKSIVPMSGSTASVGKLYVTEMAQFINVHWNIEAARDRAPSLDRCVKRLAELTD